MTKLEQIELLRNDVKELEKKLSDIELLYPDPSASIGINRQVDSLLDEILEIKALLAKREALPDIDFEQIILSLFSGMKGVDNK